MKKLWIVFALVFSLLLYSEFSAQNVSPHFSELKGMEDAQGNTHLLYRVRSSQHNGPNISASNDIFNLIPGSSTDTIFIYDGYTCNIIMGSGTTVTTYDIWNNDLSKYIYAGEFVNCFEPYFVISRFDSNFVYGDMFVDVQKIIISKQDDSLVFALPNLISTNGGFNWDTLQLDHQLVSVSPFEDAVYFSIDFSTSYTSALFKSTDSGNTFTLVDTGGNDWFPNFYYDSDGNHIYREHSTGYPNKSLKVSADQGNAFTWQTVYTSNNDIYICLDKSQSGAIYLADGNKILKSTDYGTTFTLFKELDKKVIGIYKRPNSDKLYAATKYKIYEITNDSITIIKSLPIPEEILAYYPLAVGNKWIYDYSLIDWNMNGYVDIFFREVLSEKIKSNGKKYFEILEKFISIGTTDTVYERIDSTEGKVYRYEPNCPNSEQFIEELVMEVNDSTFASRFESCIEHPPTELASQQGYSLWGFSGLNRNYLSFSLLTSDYNLYSDIGLAYVKLSDDNYFKTLILKGILKNGIVYGDTTLTDIEDEYNLPKEFRLNQNYPNPFNPSTKISWQAPIGSWQTLKVYDILGNEIVTLVNEYRNAGSYEVEFNSSTIKHYPSSGVYFYQLSATGGAGSFVETKKMILIR